MRLLIILLFLPLFSLGQDYFQQEVNHTINVRLDDKKHLLHAFEEIEYINNSPQVLDTIYMHLWPNAYTSTFTALGRQKMDDGDLDLHFSDSISKGRIDSLDFMQNGKGIPLIIDENHPDIGMLVLAESIPSGGKTTITTPFRVKIPDASFSRLGHVKDSYMITQWFPKPAVYDRDGWHPIPYLGQGEFYSEFGAYDVTITLPKNYVVGSTGDLQTSSEIEFLELKNRVTRKKITGKTLIKFDPETRRIDNSIPPSDSETKTIRYTQKNIHDFAWFADKRFHVLKSTVDLPRQKRTVTTWAMFTNREADLWINAPTYLDSAVYYYSLWNGDYPYKHATAVDGTIAAGGGMEYPNVTVIGGSGSAYSLEQVIVHEVGHNWFYGILGSNERDHPWMDEGLNSLNENRYFETRYPSGSLEDMVTGFAPFMKGKFGLSEMQTKSMHEFSYLLNARRNLDQPIEHKSVDYTPTNYGGIVYSKTAIVFDYLLAYLGDSLFDHCMQEYYEKWHFKHPGPDDLKAIFQKNTDKNLDWFFEDLIKTTKKIDFEIKNIKKDGAVAQLGIRSKGEVLSPYSLSFLKDGKLVRTEWKEALTKLDFHEVDIKGIDQIRLDYNLEIPEIDRTNNSIKTKGLFKKSKPLDFQFLGGIENPDYNTLYYTPVIGFNKYDGFMVGMSLYNHTFPEKKFEYTLTPMFAVGSFKPVGMGDAHYHIYPDGSNFIQRITIGSEYSSFQFYKEDDITGRFQKFMPYAEIDFQKKNRRSKWKHKAIFNFNYIDNFIPGNELLNGWDQTKAARIGYKVTNSQVLKPFILNVWLEQGIHQTANNSLTSIQDYSKASLEASWRFNYNWNLDGVDLRFFAGYFFKNNTFDSRFNWQLDGQNGRQDYLYDQIFLGRNQGHPDMLSQQMVENHGAFKVGTGFGSSNSWLIGGNIKVDLPLPIIALYADAGLFPIYIVNESRYEARYLYNAGVNLKIKKGLVDVFIPLAMHQDIVDEHEFQKINFLQRIRFTFNIKSINPFKLIKAIEN